MSGLFGGNQTAANTNTAVSGINVQQSVYGAPINIVYGTNRIAGNLMWYGNFISTANNSNSSSGGKGGGGSSNGPTTYTYTAAVQIGLCEGQIQGIGQVWAGQSVYAGLNAGSSPLGLSLFDGANPQTPWGWQNTFEASEALAYNSSAYVAGATVALDSSASLPAFNFEVFTNSQFGQGIVDANPAVVVADLLTNSTYGAGFPATMLGSFTQFSNYCIANGIFISPAYVAQASAADMLTEIFTVANCEAFMSEGVLKVVPYDDTPATGNGVTYTPNCQVLYSLDDDDFIYDSSTDPVVCTRADQADAYNSLAVEFANRTNQYNLQPANAYDAGSVSKYGARPAQMFSAHCIADPNVAQAAAQRMMQRGLYIRNQYAFTLGWRYCLLEPMDIIEISDAWLELTNFPVRILSVDEDADGNLAIVAEEFLQSVSSNVLYNSQPSSGYAGNYTVSPGNANAPVMFPGPLPLTNGALEVWVASSGSSPYYGGCQIWTSNDGNSYVLAGTAVGSNRMGVTTSALNAVTDPDTTSILGVNLLESNGTLSSATQAQADDEITTLCWMDNEFISYRDATLTSVGNYHLGYLWRGLYGTNNASHNANMPFVRCDNSITKISVSQSQVGQAIYVKLLAYNVYGKGYQSLAECTAYPYVIAAATAPGMAAVTGLELTGQGANTVFSGMDANFDWRANSTTNSYNVGSEPVGNAGSLGPNFKDYECRIYDANGKLIRTDHTTDTKYSYTYTNNFADNSGAPLRKFTLAVYQRGTAGQLSQVPATLTVSNPSPDTPSGMYVTAGPSSVMIGATQAAIADYAGAIIWASTVEGFTPGSANQIYNGPANSYTYVGLTPYVPIYVRMAFYDTFGSVVSQLNISSEESAIPTASGILVVSTLPATGAFIGECVYLSTDQNVYRWNGTTWTTAVSATQIIGLISAGQISALAASQITGQLTAAQIASIAAAQLTGQITTTQIAPNSISTPLLQAGAVSTANLAAGSVVAATIASGAVTATQIAAGSIQSANIAAGAINALTIGAGAVNTAALQAGSVNTPILQAGAVTAATIGAGAVQSVSLATGAVTAATIAAGAVTATALNTTNAVITNSAQMGSATVGTLTLGNNAVTIPTGAVASGSPASCTVSLTQPGAIQVIAFANVNGPTSSGTNAQMVVTMSGAAAGTAGYVGSGIPPNTYVCMSTSAMFSNLNPGTYTFSITQTSLGGGVTLSGNSIIAVGIMR